MPSTQREVNSTTIAFGRSKLQLTKSTSTFGVLPRRGCEATVKRACEKRGAHIDDSLGGFTLARYETDSESLEDDLDDLREHADVAKGTHVYYTSEDGVPFIPTGELFLRFKAASTLAERQDLLDEHKLEVVRTTSSSDIIVRITSASINPVRTAERLQGSQAIDIAEPDLATPGSITMSMAPADPFLLMQWHLANPGGAPGLTKGADARVVAAWSLAGTLGSHSVRVGLIDDGFDLEHPDLSGPQKIVAPMDFGEMDTNPRPNQGDFHGTACAGIAVGSANGVGIVGAAPGASLIPVRWSGQLNAATAMWFDHMRENGAKVVSCSWGPAAKHYPLPTVIEEAIDRCAEKAVICFAAGNADRPIKDDERGILNGFAAHPRVLTVSASTSIDTRADYSCYGKEVDLCAPSGGAGGRAITTSDIRGNSGYAPGSYTHTFSGTSSSTPLVAGVAALLLSIAPSLSVDEVIRILQVTAREIGEGYVGEDHTSPHFGYGCVNAEAAVELLLQQMDA